VKTKIVIENLKDGHQKIVSSTSKENIWFTGKIRILLRRTDARENADVVDFM